MNEEERKQYWLDILRINSSHLTQYNGATERAIKALFLINSGGIIAILAYLYKDTLPFCSKTLFILSLTLFLIGLLFAFAVVTFDYFGCLARMNGTTPLSKN